MTATTFNPLTVARAREAADAAANAERGDLATKAGLAAFATKADLEALRSELRWMLGFLAALILAMAAKLFGVV